MSFKIAFIGAGSIGFTRELLRDIMCVPEFQTCEIAFMDIDKENLDRAVQLCQRDLDANGVNIKIKPYMDRRAAFKNAKYVINCVRIGVMDGFEKDVLIPLKYGIDQCVGDTLCTGGIFYGQRGIPAILDFCKDIREVAAPDCMMLSYSNPNSMLTWAANTYGKVNTVGLCHGVQNTHMLICRGLGLNPKEVDYKCVGINHQTWFVELKKDGVDLYDGLLEKLQADPAIAYDEKPRLDVLRNFGYFCTETSGHFSEYVSWYRAKPEDSERWCVNNVWRNGETAGYYRLCSERNHFYEAEFQSWLDAPAWKFAPEERSIEHASFIIEAIETGRIYRGHFNRINNGVVTNLPDDCVIEAPGFVDRNGINMAVYGDLPSGCAAVCSQSVWVQRLAVEAAITGDIQKLRQAMLMDPLTAAVLEPDMIRQLCDEMLVEEAQWLPQYQEEIEKAKARLAAHYEEPKPFIAPLQKRVRSLEELLENKEESMSTYNKPAAKHG